MYQLTTRPTDSSSSTSPARCKSGKLVGWTAHMGLVVAICAAVGVGVLAGPRAASSHHTVVSAPSHLVAQSLTLDITGGPGSH